MSVIIIKSDLYPKKITYQLPNNEEGVGDIIKQYEIDGLNSYSEVIDGTEIEFTLGQARKKENVVYFYIYRYNEDTFSEEINQNIIHPIGVFEIPLKEWEKNPVIDENTFEEGVTLLIPSIISSF